MTEKRTLGVPADPALTPRGDGEALFTIQDLNNASDSPDRFGVPRPHYVDTLSFGLCRQDEEGWFSLGLGRYLTDDDIYGTKA